MELQSYSLKFVVVIIGIFFGIITELTTFFYQFLLFSPVSNVVRKASGNTLPNLKSETLKLCRESIFIHDVITLKVQSMREFAVHHGRQTKKEDLSILVSRDIKLNKYFVTIHKRCGKQLTLKIRTHTYCQ